MHNLKSHFWWDFWAYCTRPASVHLPFGDGVHRLLVWQFFNLFAQFKTSTTKSHENYVFLYPFSSTAISPPPPKKKKNKQKNKKQTNPPVFYTGNQHLHFHAASTVAFSQKGTRSVAFSQRPTHLHEKQINSPCCISAEGNQPPCINNNLPCCIFMREKNTVSSSMKNYTFCCIFNEKQHILLHFQWKTTHSVA